MKDEIKIENDLKSMDDFQADIERFFTHFSQWKRPSAFFEKAWKPYCDIYESEGHLHVIVEISGVSEDEVEAILENRTLIVRGNRPQVHPRETKYTHQVEINFGKFERTLELPFDVDAEKTTATYRNGFLHILLPKLKNTSKEIHIIE
jgi:HSP20 family protein